MNKKILLSFAVSIFLLFHQNAHGVWTSDEGWGMPVASFGTETDQVYFNVPGTSWPSGGLVWIDPDGLVADPGTPITRRYVYYGLELIGSYAFMEVKSMNRKPGTWHVLYGTDSYPFEILPSAHMTLSRTPEWKLDIITDMLYPRSDPRGLAFDGTYLWIADFDDLEIHKLNTSGEIIKSFEISHHGPEGLAYDGTYLLNVDHTTDRIYQLDISEILVGTAINSFSSPGPDPEGLTTDGTHLWNSDSVENRIYQLDPLGNLIDSRDSPGPGTTGLTVWRIHMWNSDSTDDKIYNIPTQAEVDSPGQYPSGLTHDGTYLWCADDAFGNGKIYKLDTSGTVVDSFDAPGAGLWGIRGLAFDGEFLWAANYLDRMIYKLNTSGTILDSFASPGMGPGGLTFDGTYLWNIDTADSRVYKIETDGDQIGFFAAPGSNPRGLTFDGSYFWISDFDDRKIYQLDTSGTLVATFDSPGPRPTGLAFDGSYLRNADLTDDKIYGIVFNNSFVTPGPSPYGLTYDGTHLWNADVDVDSGKIFKLDTSGSIIDAFDSPGPWPTGLAFDGTYLWNADSIDDKIYKLDTSGAILGSFDSPGPEPTGLASDGTYLWNADSNDNLIYQLEVSTEIKGTVVNEFDCPCISQGSGCGPEGLAFDGTYFWHSNAARYPENDRIFKLDTSLNIIDDTIRRPEFSDTFYLPMAFGHLAFDSTYLWNSDLRHEKIYLLDTSGNVIDYFDSPGSNPRGIAYHEGTLWHADWATDKIYKLWRPGLVEAGLSRLETFTIGERENVSDYGYDVLEIGTISITGTDAADYSIQNDNCSGQSLAAAQECTFDLLFSPASAGEKSALLQITSNEFPSPKQIPLSGKGVVGLCEDDRDHDIDVDGSDLAAFASAWGPQADMAILAGDFGRTNCAY